MEVRNLSDISKRLRECIENKYSYKELEKLTGIPKSAIQRYASGTTEKIPMDRLGSLANALAVSTAYLMGWEDPEPEPQVDERHELLIRLFDSLPEASQEAVLVQLRALAQFQKDQDGR
jgi:transcriptional regulator with XRE-family HTH domain